MNPLMPFIVLVLAPLPFIGYLVRRGQYSMSGLFIVLLALAFYYAQGPDDIEFVKLWGRPLAALLYVSILAPSITAYIIERRKDKKHGI